MPQRLYAHQRSRVPRPRRRGALLVAVFAVSLMPGARFAVPAGAATSVLSIDDVTVTEGDSGSRDAEFTISLVPPAQSDVTVDAFTANGSAVGGTDYRLVSETVTVKAGESKARVVVPVLGDLIGERDEQFTVRLTNASDDVVIGDDSGEARIVDDDLTPRLTVSDAEVHEDEDAVFLVSLFPPAEEKVTVEFSTANDTNDEAANSPYDYVDAAGLIEFRPGETEQRVIIPIHDDLVSEEPIETFFLQLSNPTGDAEIADDEGMGRIFDNDVLPQLTVADVEIVEGNEGYRECLFTVELYPPSVQRVTVEFFTENDEAVAGQDYLATAGVLNFLPGETLKQIPVPVRGDIIDERDTEGNSDDDDDDDDDDDENRDGEDKKAVRETFEIKLEDSLNAEIADDDARCSIIDDDLLPGLFVDDVTLTEGDEGTQEMRFPVRLFPASGDWVTVDYATRDSDAKAPGDYQAIAGQLYFAPGETEKIVAVVVRGDFDDEEDESFNLVLTDGVHAPIQNERGEGTIIDDDFGPALSVEDATVEEGDDGQTAAEVVVRLTEPSPQLITFELATADGSATSPDDYTPVGGKRSIAPGATELVIEVPVNGDTDEEEDEEIKVEISNATNASVAKASAVVVIVEDDTPPAPHVAMVSNPAGRGYWVGTGAGEVYAFGGASYHGGVEGKLNRPIVSMAATPSGDGYWLAGADGAVFAFGDARFHGSTGDITLNQPIVAMTATPSAGGYWLTASDGGVFSFGDARFHGSTGDITLNRPIVGMAVPPSGGGYWLVASDGGVFSFGEASFRGSTGDLALNRPIVAMATTPTGRGYWLTASDGGVFSFGDAGFHGSTGDITLRRPISAMAATPTAGGYWLGATDGGIFAFGDARFAGSAAGPEVP